MYKSIVIVGVGLIGGSLGLAFRRRYPDARITGVSSSSAVRSALDMGAITGGCGYEELGNAVAGADVVFLCTPISRIQGLLTLIAPFVREGMIVTDVGSTKREIARHAASVLPAGVHFIGGHPMAGSESRGVQAADPFLFQNAIYVLTPAGDVSPETLDGFSSFLGETGARVMVMDADLHDRIAAAVSHLPQLLAVALVETAGRLDGAGNPYLRLAAGGFRDMTRIASSPFGMWDDIFRTNGDMAREMVDAFIAQLRTIRDRIGTSALGEDFEIANVTRATIPKDTKGFMRALFDVLVVVEDQPGVIAQVSTELSRNGINIKDIEVLKVREGEGGTLRLAFERETEAQEAVSLLARIGYTARLRR